MIFVAKLDRMFRPVAQTIVDFDRIGIELVASAEGLARVSPYIWAMAC